MYVDCSVWYNAVNEYVKCKFATRRLLLVCCMQTKHFTIQDECIVKYTRPVLTSVFHNTHVMYCDAMQ